jgi:LCP family protein required for cell wall assembly
MANRHQVHSPPAWMGKRRRRRGIGCSFVLVVTLAVFILGLIYCVFLFAPFRTNVLLLGIDYTPLGTALGRSDTIIVATFIPFDPYVAMISIPRDLWVQIPGVGENRINTAHFFAESTQPGTGPRAAIETIKYNFGVDIGYYIRVQFDGFREIVGALGGVDIYLEKPMAGYSAGYHHLTGRKALAFARNRYGSDDFYRMEQGQLIMKAVFSEMLAPENWIRLPGVLLSFSRVVDTNIPWWQWPRLVIALLRLGPEGIDRYLISREMVTPYTTNMGASVLLPNWESINLLFMHVFK